jgi:hypothetical protein
MHDEIKAEAQAFPVMAPAHQCLKSKVLSLPVEDKNDPNFGIRAYRLIIHHY